MKFGLTLTTRLIVKLCSANYRQCGIHRDRMASQLCDVAWPLASLTRSICYWVIDVSIQRHFAFSHNVSLQVWVICHVLTCRHCSCRCII